MTGEEAETFGAVVLDQRGKVGCGDGQTVDRSGIEGHEVDVVVHAVGRDLDDALR